MPRTPAHREEGSWRSREGLLEAKNRSHKPAIAVAISAACARDKEMTASRRSIGCDEPLVQRRRCAAAAMAKAAGQGDRESRYPCALRAQSNIAARTPPASQNVLRVRPQANRGRNRTRAARDAAESRSAELGAKSYWPRKAPHKCPTATPTAPHGPAALAGTRATAALASSRSERPTSRDGGRDRRRREKKTHLGAGPAHQDP